MRMPIAVILLACLGSATASGQCAPAPDSPYFFRNLAEQRITAEIAAKPAVAGKRFFSISNYTLLEHRQGYTVATYLLIAIVKKELQLNASLYTCLQILSVSIFEKTELSCALQPERSQREVDATANQLILFDF